MPEYKVKAQRRELGGYTFSYGKGSKKLTCQVGPVGDKWAVLEGDGLSHLQGSQPLKLSSLKKRWGEWASENYGKEQAPEPEDLEAESESAYDDPFADDEDEFAEPVVDDGPSWQPGDDPCFLEQMTDYDVINVDKLIQRYGPDQLVRWIQEYDGKKLFELIDRGMWHRRRIQEALKQGMQKHE